MLNFQFLKSHAAILALHILILVGLEQLLLSGLVLFVLRLKVTEFAIQFIQIVLQF